MMIMNIGFVKIVGVKVGVKMADSGLNMENVILGNLPIFSLAYLEMFSPLPRVILLHMIGK